MKALPKEIVEKIAAAKQRVENDIIYEYKIKEIKRGLRRFYEDRDFKALEQIISDVLIDGFKMTDDEREALDILFDMIFEGEMTRKDLAADIVIRSIKYGEDLFNVQQVLVK